MRALPVLVALCSLILIPDPVPAGPVLPGPAGDWVGTYATSEASNELKLQVGSGTWAVGRVRGKRSAP